MDALEFLKTFGKAAAEKLADDAETNYAYFSQIAYGHRRPSVELALKLVEKSGQRLSFEGLLLTKRPKKSHRRGKKRPRPSKAR